MKKDFIFAIKKLVTGRLNTDVRQLFHAIYQIT